MGLSRGEKTYEYVVAHGLTHVKEACQEDTEASTLQETPGELKSNYFLVDV